MNFKNKSKLFRVDKEFVKDLEDMARVRVAKGLAKPRKEEMSIREMTHLIRRTDGWQLTKNEMKWKAKRK